MPLESKNEFPSQKENRKQWILDAVRANQSDVAALLFWVGYRGRSKMSWAHKAAQILLGMHKMDRDAILLPGGILTDEQIQAIRDEMREMPAIVLNDPAKATAVGNGEGSGHEAVSDAVPRVHAGCDRASKLKELQARGYSERQIAVMMHHWDEGIRRAKKMPT